jgi:hypothetical protein
MIVGILAIVQQHSAATVSPTTSAAIRNSISRSRINPKNAASAGGERLL